MIFFFQHKMSFCWNLNFSQFLFECKLIEVFSQLQSGKELEWKFELATGKAHCRTVGSQVSSLFFNEYSVMQYSVISRFFLFSSEAWWRAAGGPKQVTSSCFHKGFCNRAICMNQTWSTYISSIIMVSIFVAYLEWTWQ